MNVVKLKDISINNRGYYGIGASAIDYDKKKFTYLRITDINDDGELNIDGLMSVDDKKADKYILKKNDIVFARTGASVGKTYFYDGEIKNMVYAGFLVKFSLDDKKVNPRYIKYYCLSQKYKDWIFASFTGSTRPNINEKQLANMPIILPDRKYQNIIVKLLDLITNKIKLNNSINNNLYNVAQELINNDFNTINDFIQLKNVINFVKGKKPKNIVNRKKKGYKKYLTIACLNGQELNYADIDKMIIANNDLLMVMDGASSGDIYFSDCGIVGSTLAKLQIFNNLYQKGYVFFCIKKYSNLIKSKTTGSAIPHTDKVFVGSLEIPKLDIKKQEKYKALLSKIQHNQNENETLTQLRDTLLPKLMNGEIDLDNVGI